MRNDEAAFRPVWTPVGLDVRRRSCDAGMGSAQSVLALPWPELTARSNVRKLELKPGVNVSATIKRHEERLCAGHAEQKLASRVEEMINDDSAEKPLLVKKRHLKHHQTVALASRTLLISNSGAKYFRQFFHAECDFQKQGFFHQNQMIRFDPNDPSLLELVTLQRARKSPVMLMTGRVLS